MWACLFLAALQALARLARRAGTARTVALLFALLTGARLLVAGYEALFWLRIVQEGSPAVVKAHAVTLSVVDVALVVAEFVLLLTLANGWRTLRAGFFNNQAVHAICTVVVLVCVCSLVAFFDVQVSKAADADRR